eukprot:TRINITY_DN39157_c0_g1_i1.p1 TRINITY_DN39157_c0_g1~~TRINITY_DN39157_c0_g1_i1.p1  ORF type:complete len:584 (+),score=204.57 TRINITY_DN39157_c0_g1_i1:58-1752(+)
MAQAPPSVGYCECCNTRGSDSEQCNLITLGVHFLHPMLCTINYLSWVRNQRGDDRLGDARVDAYLALTIIAMLAFFLVSSAFYILAHRWPHPLHRSTKRTSWGVFLNLFLSDLPIFILEVDMTWAVGWASGIQAVCMLVTIVSFATSGIRSWLFCVGRFIRHEVAREEAADGRTPGSPGMEPQSPGANTGAYEQLDVDARQAASGRPPGFFLPAHWMEEQHVVPLLCMLLWLLSTVMSLVNYVAYLRTSAAKDLYGGLTGAYLCFVIVSLLVYFTIATTMWLWSWRYSKARVLRRRKTVTGILAMFFLSNCPLWAMDYRTVDVAGVDHATQMLSLLFQSIMWLLGAITLWLTYAHIMTRDMHEGRCLPAIAASPYRGGARPLPPDMDTPAGVDAARMRPHQLMQPEYRWRSTFSWDPPPPSPMPLGAAAAPAPLLQQQHSPHRTPPPPASSSPQGLGPPTLPQQRAVFESPTPTSPPPQASTSPMPFVPAPVGRVPSSEPIAPPPGTQVVRTPSPFGGFGDADLGGGGGRAGGIVPEGGITHGQVPSPTFHSPTAHRYGQLPAV